MSEKRIIKLDASALKESSCMRRLYWNVVEGWREATPNNDTEFGSAVHEYIKVMRLNPGRFDLATQAANERYSVPMRIKAKKQYMTKEYLILVCQSLWLTYLSNDLFETVIVDGKPLVELKFSWPFYSDDDLEIILCGTIDDVCKHKYGTYAIRDYKTTSVGESDTYLHGYYLSAQLLFYRLIIRYHALRYPDSIWGTLERQNTHCFIDGIFLRGASKPAEFIRSDIFSFDQAQLDEFEKLVKLATTELVYYLKQGTVPDRQGMLNDSCTTKFGPCKYFNACKQPSLNAAQRILANTYIQKPYDPLNFQ